LKEVDLLSKIHEYSNISVFNLVGSLDEKLSQILNPRLGMYKENIDGSPDENDDCSICFEIYGKEKVSQCQECKNFFHKECISIWLRKSSRTTCPLCRSEWISLATISDDPLLKFRRLN
jgi:NAD-dependent SIR2 family protein deacetylase